MTMHVQKKPKCSKGLAQLSLGQGRGLWPQHPCGPRTLAYVADSCQSSWSWNQTPPVPALVLLMSPAVKRRKLLPCIRPQLSHLQNWDKFLLKRLWGLC